LLTQYATILYYRRTHAPAQVRKAQQDLPAQAFPALPALPAPLVQPAGPARTARTAATACREWWAIKAPLDTLASLVSQARTVSMGPQAPMARRARTALRAGPSRPLAYAVHSPCRCARACDLVSRTLLARAERQRHANPRRMYNAATASRAKSACPVRPARMARMASKATWAILARMAPTARPATTARTACPAFPVSMALLAPR
jgi:hypothetical protein